MINLKKTYDKVVKDISEDLVLELPELVKTQHLSGKMIDGTTLPIYNPSTIGRKNHYRGHADLQQSRAMHRSVVAYTTKDRVTVTINMTSYILLLATISRSGKVWKHWYQNNTPIGHPFKKIMQKRNKTL